MCAPFALWSSFLHACEPRTVEEREVHAARHALAEALAGAALDARATSREHQKLGRRRWHACTLAFSDAHLEKAFAFYYAHLRSGRMRRQFLRRSRWVTSPRPSRLAGRVSKRTTWLC